MQKKIIRKLLVIGLFFYLPQSAMAWGVLGHRIVGQIADSYLNRQAQKEIFKILGTESIAIASNWPDFIKSDPAFAYLSPWHYINLKPGLDEAAVKAYLDTDTATDAYTKINFLVAQLKNREMITKSRYYIYAC